MIGVASAFIEDTNPSNLEPKEFLISTSTDSKTVNLYIGRQQDDIWYWLEKEIVYLDITGLPHHIWAPLLLSANRVGQEIKVIYVEPAEYSRNNDEDYAYDLSDDVLGIKPLPGFASLQPTGDNFCFIPILGFEGVRFSYAITSIAPPDEKTFPIIGIPGFRPEYPFETYISNQLPLSIDNSTNLLNVKYADASCPFSIFYLLENIFSDNENDILKIALLGTKPHALGAILFSMNKDTSKIQLIYDYPKRKSGRTSGIGRIYIYHVSFFLSMLATFST
jgi:hypothetical protein